VRKIDIDRLLLLVFGVGAEVRIIDAGSGNHYTGDVV
jgi:hypothetical protein